MTSSSLHLLSHITPLATEHFVYYCHKISEKRLSPGTSGNVSLRHEDFIFITASGLSMEEVEPYNILKVDIKTGHVQAPDNTAFQPSSEWPMHKAIYQARPDIHAILHAHPTKATALAACHDTLQPGLIAESVAHLGNVPLIPYELPGTDALAKCITDHIGDANAILLTNHGAIVMGATLREAYYRLELLESMAELQWTCYQHPKGPKPLDAKAIAALK